MHEGTFGIDLGTFHTTSAWFTRGMHRYRLPQTPGASRAFSVPSRAATTPFRAGADLPDGEEAEIVSPKLSFGRASSEHDRMLTRVLGALARQVTAPAVWDLQTTAGVDAVVSVPPGWTQSQCDAIRGALQSDRAVRFIHEPIALLVGVLDLADAARDWPGAREVLGALLTSRTVVVCDWGAGTVDIATARVEPRSVRWVGSAAPSCRESIYECLYEETVLGCGGHDLAAVVAGDGRAANLLQMAWAGRCPMDVAEMSRFELAAGPHRESMADRVAQAILAAAEVLPKQERAETILLIYGGPLESSQLREALVRRVGPVFRSVAHVSAALVDGASRRASSLGLSAATRESLIAMGAARFGASGDAKPEFDYELLLHRPDRANLTPVRLSKRGGQEGVTPLTPTHTGVDWHVDIWPLGRPADKRTVGLFVRPQATLLCRIENVDVGGVQVSVVEAADELVPRPFSDARKASARFDERSTRFSIPIP
jgi:hypothetical protein